MATIKGRALLGWMERDAAVRFLREDCVFDPPLSEQGAEAVWQNYRQTVQALPPRQFSVPAHLGLTTQEAFHGQQFMAFLNGLGPHDVVGVQKVDLRELSVIQYLVVKERAEEYQPKVGGNQWLSECLPLHVPLAQIQFRFQQNRMDTYSEIDVPHGEFFFAPDPTGAFGARQFLRHVTCMIGADRGFLFAGYHRSFARVLNEPPGTVPSAMVAVARNSLTSPAAANAAPGVNTGNVAVDPLCPFGVQAAKFGDFFTDGLFIDVDLRKKCFQLQVSAKLVALDDPT